jgi:hypothetical protein
VSAEEIILNPEDPVSTNIPSIGWQLEVPGTQTVMLAKAPFT